MVITRFAPSPTGDLHIGSARTALFCWLWSKNQKGKYILRIEDTDRERSTEEAVNVIIKGLEWLGLTWDEGPIFQTQRYPRYEAVANQLLEQGDAYRCYCSKERLEKLREEQIAAKQKARYDGHCRDNPQKVDPNQPFVLRFKTPQTGSVVFKDMVKGVIETSNSELDDLIIVRTDGNPTYNFTVVVDDADMQITHVLRGDDHINNTPRQIHILNALKAKIPEYGHMPMLLAPDGKKLSKRTGAASVLEYRSQGILPKALINYLVRLGWSHGDQEIFTLDEMIQYFDVHKINVSPAALNPEKLLWLNQYYLKNEPPEEIAIELKTHLTALDLAWENGPDVVLVVKALRDRCKTLAEMAQKSQFLYKDITIDETLLKKHLSEEGIKALLAFNTKLLALVEWEPSLIKQAMDEVITEEGIKMGALAPLIRVAATGNLDSPPIDITLSLLGKEKSLVRLNNFIAAHTKR